MVYSLELLRAVKYRDKCHLRLKEKKDDVRNEDASGKEMFEDSETPVFSVNLEKALRLPLSGVIFRALTNRNGAPRCGLPVRPHGLQTREAAEPILSRSPLSIFPLPALT